MLPFLAYCVKCGVLDYRPSLEEAEEIVRAHQRLTHHHVYAAALRLEIEEGRHARPGGPHGS